MFEHIKLCQCAEANAWMLYFNEMHETIMKSKKKNTHTHPFYIVRTLMAIKNTCLVIDKWALKQREKVPTTRRNEWPRLCDTVAHLKRNWSNNLLARQQQQQHLVPCINTSNHLMPHHFFPIFLYTFIHQLLSSLLFLLILQLFFFVWNMNGKTASINDHDKWFLCWLLCLHLSQLF